MEHQQFSEIPALWSLPVPPCPWVGIDVRHYETKEDCELLDCMTPGTVWISVLKRPPKLFETKRRLGIWQKIAVDPGTVSYVPSDFVLNGRWIGGAETVNVQIDINWLQGSGIEPLSLHNEPLEGIRDVVLAQLIDDIYQDSLSGTPFGVERSECMALSALYRLMAIGKCDGKWNHSPHYEIKISSALEYIHSNIDSNLSIKEIAQATQFESNLYSFSRQFKQQVGMSPHQYVLEVRLEHAKNMLLGRRESVTEIALNCGFQNLSHFSDAFKKKWGKPPSSFRTVKN